MNSHSLASSEYIETGEHFRPRQYAPIWRIPPAHWQERLAAAIEKNPANHAAAVFLRADDIGAGGRAFEAMCRLFRYHQAPLAMAVVPAWLSGIRRRQLFEIAPLDEPLWGWHQHGWRHVNWQRSGKSSEFGEQRPLEKQWKDIHQGQQKMQEIFGKHFTPVFTPPWNRLSTATLKILQDLEFAGVSATKPFPRGVKPPIVLKNLRINIDLHTRNAKDGTADFQALLDDLTSLLVKKELFGIMVHHHRMNRFAFDFLDELLRLLRERARARFLSFEDILENRYGG